MSGPEYPAFTDAEKIMFSVAELARVLEQQQLTLDALTTAVNTTGQQVQWLIDNVGGILAMLNSPQAMSQLMGQFTGMIGGGNGGRPAASADAG